MSTEHDDTATCARCGKVYNLADTDADDAVDIYCSRKCQDADVPDEAEWRQEIAREEGMLHGVAAYNDVLGQSVEEPDIFDEGDHRRMADEGDREDFHSDLGVSFSDAEPHFPGE